MIYFYYGFGGFIGFVCGLVINLIFYAVEKSGHPILTNLGKDYGVLGRYLIEVFNALPYLGIVVGVVLVHYMFGRQFGKGVDGDSSAED